MPDELTSSLDDAAQLEALGERFTLALNLKDRGDIDRAEELFLEILRAEPRLPEPRMELARLLLDTDRIEDAEGHARLALDHLKAGGRWTDMLPDGVVESIAHALLAEILRRRLEDDDVIFGDPATFKALLTESREHFAAAHRLDPTDETSSYYANYLGAEPGSPAGES